MWQFTFSLSKLLTFTNVVMSSVLVILAFSLLGYTLTYNIRNSVARRFALLLGCLMIVYAGDVALTRVVSADSTERWLRFQWLGIAILPAAAYLFSLAVLQTTNFRLHRRHWVGFFFLALALFFAGDAILGRQVVGDIQYKPPISYLQAGPLFWFFTLYFGLAMLFSLANVAKAGRRCLTPNSRQRMTYLLLGFVAPGIGVFPYLIALSQGASVGQASSLVLILSLFGNLAVAAMLVLLSYTVAYFGVLTPDRVVRYRLLRFFMRGPVVAILVILAMTTLPTVERIIGLPRDMVVFSVITGVIVASQLLLSVTKAIVDRLIYREDRDEIGWLSELDRRLLTTSDLRQFLENNLAALCELLRVPAGFVAAVDGTELMLEAVIGGNETRALVQQVADWPQALERMAQQANPLRPLSHAWLLALAAL